jgi:hypothetical protein
MPYPYEQAGPLHLLDVKVEDDVNERDDERGISEDTPAPLERGDLADTEVAGIGQRKLPPTFHMIFHFKNVLLLGYNHSNSFWGPTE